MNIKLKLVAEYILDELELLKNKPQYFDLIKRNIQVKMWDKANTKSFFTGKITKDALKSGERVKEHWYGATQLALDIIDMKNPTINMIINEIESKLTWNYTTKKENWILANNKQDYSLISELVDFNK